MQSVSENNERIFHIFNVRIRNFGVMLHDVRTSLNFTGPSGTGSISLPLKNDQSIGGHNEFARCMVAAFYLKSYEMRSDEIQTLGLLRDTTIQDACLCIYSQGLLAASFRIGGRIDTIKHQWNRAAHRINRMFESYRPAVPGGPRLIHAFRIIPVFQTLDWKVQYFIDAISRDGKN